MTGLLHVRTEAESCKYVKQSRAFCKHGGTGALKSRQVYAEVSQMSSLRSQQCTASKHDTRTCNLICLQKPSPSPSEEKGQKGPGRNRKCLQAGGKLGDGARVAEQPRPFPSTKAILFHLICRRQKLSKLTRPSYPLPPGPALTEPGDCGAVSSASLTWKASVGPSAHVSSAHVLNAHPVVHPNPK